MEAFTFSNFVQMLKRQLAQLRKKPFVILAIALVLLGKFIDSRGELQSLQALCQQIVTDLGHIQPFGMIRLYFERLTACDPMDAALGGGLNCYAVRYIAPGRYVGAVFGTIADVWAISDIPGRILLPFALVVSFPIGMLLVPTGLFRRLFGQGTYEILVFVGGALLTPFIASLVALVLQVLAIALFWVFGALIGLAILLVTIFGSLWEAFKFASEVQERAEKLEKTSNTVLKALGKAPPEGGGPSAH